MLIDDMDEAREVAGDAAEALEQAKHRMSGKCWGADYASGPHEGCSEFAPDVRHQCQRDDTQWVLIWDDFGGPPEAAWELLCAHHQDEYQSYAHKYEEMGKHGTAVAAR